MEAIPVLLHNCRSFITRSPCISFYYKYVSILTLVTSHPSEFSMVPPPPTPAIAHMLTYVFHACCIDVGPYSWFNNMVHGYVLKHPYIINMYMLIK